MSVIFYANSIMARGFDAAAEPSVAGQIATMSGGEASDDPAPLYDLLDNRRTNTLSLDTNGETAAATIQIETTLSLTATAMIADNHNFKTADAKYHVTQGGVVVTTSAAYSGTLGSELSADSISADIATAGADGVSLLLFASAADLTWQLVVDDVATFDADVTLGEIVLSSGLATTTNPELQPIFGHDIPGASFRETEGGQRYGFSTHNNSRKSWRMTWKYMTYAQKGNLEDVYTFTRGSKHPFYIDLSGPLGNTNPTLFYVRFMKPLNFTGITKDAWQVVIDIEEEI